MKISFFGAAGEVTGSCHLVETSQARVLIDFGLHQGSAAIEQRNTVVPPIDAGRLDAVLVTHAHIDHIGRLPLLPNAGFNRSIYATPATCDLAVIMLRDSARIQEGDAERATRRNPASSELPIAPLYTEADAEKVLPLFKPVAYDTPTNVAPGITARWVDAGHMLGSASIELTIEDAGKVKTVVFSGDIGVRGAALLRDPVYLSKADLVVMESTYGDRDHKALEPTLDEFKEIIDHAVWSHEKVLIPAFAVGRTQQMAYYLNQLIERGRLPKFPVYVDSPMASAAIELYKKYQHDLDSATAALVHNGTNPLAFQDLICTRSADESKALNYLQGAAVIIAASGMCTGGRILHHLRHNVWRRDVHVIIAGFQAVGTIGRQLVDGAKAITIFGDRVPVRATVSTLGGFSAHAGQTELLAWLASLMKQPNKPRVVLVHGEEDAREKLRTLIVQQFGVPPKCPEYADHVEL